MSLRRIIFLPPDSPAYFLLRWLVSELGLMTLSASFFLFVLSSDSIISIGLSWYWISVTWLIKLNKSYSDNLVSWWMAKSLKAVDL